MADKSISEVQSEIAAALKALPDFSRQLPDVLKPLAYLAPPRGLGAEISLRHGHAKDSRQVRRTAPFDSWAPQSGIVTISYSETGAEGPAGGQTTFISDVGGSNEAGKAAAADPVQDLIRALAKAEQDPQLDFVSLKWFRDSFLPQQGHPWAASADDRQHALVDAINRGWVLTSRVPNPKNPQFPVTAIRLNRPLAEVRAVVGDEPLSRPQFKPISIPGEHLSETVLRARR